MVKSNVLCSQFFNICLTEVRIGLFGPTDITRTKHRPCMVTGLREWAHSALKFPAHLCGAEGEEGNGSGVPYHGSYPGCAAKSSWVASGGTKLEHGHMCARNRARGLYAC